MSATHRKVGSRVKTTIYVSLGKTMPVCRPSYEIIKALYRIMKRSVAESVPDRASVHTRNAGFEAVESGTFRIG